MQQKSFRFNHSTVNYFFEASFADLKKIAGDQRVIIITDENLFAHYAKHFKGYDTIVLKPGEEYKVQTTVNAVMDQLIEMGTDRHTLLVGVGGGVITDLTGYIAATYMRGISFGFVPTSLLAMVDAAIGGKNGVDVGLYKNLVGTIRQPSFILYDPRWLKTLPGEEWRNGFAEIIKHALIKDPAMIRLLEAKTLRHFQKNKADLSSLIRRNALLKTKVVQGDELETGERKLLNFGHTLGHALENQYELSHGQAVAIGMSYAAVLSAQITGFKYAERVVALLEQYELPAFADFNKDKVMAVLKMDKKRQQEHIHFILLEKPGKAAIYKLPLEDIYSSLP